VAKAESENSGYHLHFEDEIHFQDAGAAAWNTIEDSA
jgi:hypothetical protein